ncbi:hypothetical protein NQ318_010541 [Aromia moschata]|uniref:MADF domain-containing protein n=1 Tax=Aromia moschata TaxID=1265417 RepID=A0AAV8YE15_9CUCU|nr:hypothetical protein NQ318_010541 [Aromia moschata]
MQEQDPLNPVTDQERFIRELIQTFKERPVLWDKNHPHYRNRAERYEAYEALLIKCREYYPEADEDFAKMKIDSLRSSFRKEWNKVSSSKEVAKVPEDVYKPSLWYYSLLLFTVGEECPEQKNLSADLMRLFWTREYTTILIGLLKKHPCLYANNPIPTLAKRNEALKKSPTK